MDALNEHLKARRAYMKATLLMCVYVYRKGGREGAPPVLFFWPQVPEDFRGKNFGTSA